MNHVKTWKNGSHQSALRGYTEWEKAWNWVLGSVSKKNAKLDSSISLHIRKSNVRCTVAPASSSGVWSRPACCRLCEARSWGESKPVGAMGVTSFNVFLLWRSFGRLLEIFGECSTSMISMISSLLCSISGAILATCYTAEWCWHIYACLPACWSAFILLLPAGCAGSAHHHYHRLSSIWSYAIVRSLESSQPE